MRLLVVTLLVTTFALAASANTDPPPRKLPSKVTFHKAPSEESPAARATRLRRECKGRPNAGACLGHASP
ncbi:MAG: hypothetical protein MUE35_06310 [Hydrogenophaga sp.]|jgi:hypothetical protein|nr:hypothetical protein [Hydrogenophaga sp.]